MNLQNLESDIVNLFCIKYNAVSYTHLDVYKRQLNDLAKFVPCAAHSLNLVGVHAVEVSIMMTSCFWKSVGVFLLL